MTALQRELWSRLAAFSLDDPDASLSFSRRLARENGWTHAFAQRVIDEYKRFVLLAMTAGHQVTPSDEVDQAWHLHLTYSRSYWDELCGGVLGRPLHHGPTKGGKQEGDRFEDQYERTLDSYRDAFGEAPPADIWPPSEVRFGEASDFVRVNRQRVWMLPKPGKRSSGIAAAFTGLGIGVPLVAAGEDWTVLVVLLVIMAVFIGVAAIGASGAPRRRRDKSDRSGDAGGFWWGCGSGGDGGDSGCGGSGCGGGGCGGCGG